MIPPSSSPWRFLFGPLGPASQAEVLPEQNLVVLRLPWVWGPLPAPGCEGQNMEKHGKTHEKLIDKPTINHKNHTKSFISNIIQPWNWKLEKKNSLPSSKAIASDTGTPFETNSLALAVSRLKLKDDAMGSLPSVKPLLHGNEVVEQATDRWEPSLVVPS